MSETLIGTCVECGLIRPLHPYDGRIATCASCIARLREDVDAVEEVDPDA